MCGIVGYFYLNGRKIGNTSRILDMLSVQRHRGPDDSGIRGFSFENKKSKEYSISVTEETDSFEGIIGFNRLSILDLSKNGHQPMCSSDEKVILTLNGEIYNAFDFKDELSKDGFVFKSTTDTEVALNLYIKYGFDGMIKRLNGMFAIVVVDVRTESIFIARDRFGIKPMYLYKTDEVCIFASEIKTFQLAPEFRSELNVDLLDEYLLFRSTINQSLFKGVICLEPGSYVQFDPEKGFQTKQFFDIENYCRKSDDRDIDSSISMLRKILKESVNRQLLSDVKLGCQLSGGVDSSLVTQLASEIKGNDLLESVSITLNDPRFSEEVYMDHVLKKLNIKAHKFQLDASYYLANIENATWHLEAPLNHPNTIGIYLLSQQAKKVVTVLLSGEGADEVFGGYARFGRINKPYEVKTLLSALKKNRKTLYPFIKGYLNSGYRAILASSFMNRHLAGRLKSDFNFDKASSSRKALYDTLTGSLFDKQVKYEIKTYLPDLLTRQDKMSMAHSIENRVPFLDNEMVEHAFLIPEKHLIPDSSARTTKFALKKLAARQYGEPFAFRPKQGFGIPIGNFFKDTHFNQYLNDQLIPGIERSGIFNSKLIRRWTENLDLVTSEELDALWIILAFEVWAQKFKVKVAAGRTHV